MSTTYEQERTEAEKKIDALVLARVKRGLAWLEKTHGPGWEDKITLETLELDDASSCILGQVYQEEADECNLADGFDYAIDHYGVDVEECGFDCGSGVRMEQLQEAWEHVLTPLVKAT